MIAKLIIIKNRITLLIGMSILSKRFAKLTSVSSLS